MEGNLEGLNRRIDNIAKGLRKAEDLLEERENLRSNQKADILGVTSKIGIRSQHSIVRPYSKLPS